VVALARTVSEEVVHVEVTYWLLDGVAQAEQVTGAGPPRLNFEPATQAVGIPAVVMEYPARAMVQEAWEVKGPAVAGVVEPAVQAVQEELPALE